MAIDAKDYAAAERWATEGIEIDVMDADLHRVVAESAAKRHNYTEAVEEYETAVELKPDDSKPQFALAETLIAGQAAGQGPRGAQAAVEAIARLPRREEAVGEHQSKSQARSSRSAP